MNAEEFRRLIESTKLVPMSFWFLTPENAGKWLAQNPWVDKTCCPCPWTDKYHISAEDCQANRDNGGVCGRQTLADFLHQAAEGIFPDNLIPLYKIVRPAAPHHGIGQLMFLNVIIIELSAVAKT